MKNKVYINQLMTPIWALYNVDNITDVKFTIESAKRIANLYPREKLDNMYNALKWAEKNSNYDFLEIMNEAPTHRKLKFSNSEIFKHLMSFKKFMENEEFGLLTDDTPPNQPLKND
ncbi:conserved protein of unknown function [Tenacibaculum sp. 190524A02b]|uniref:hypothetical protein n=1 Tax=Tenacibaculum vairaonense TaxID=3137860 RepID=UPI0032B194AC